MPASCHIYEVETGMNINELYGSLPDYRSTHSHEDLQESLLTDFADIERTDTGVAATIRYDRPLRIGARPEEPNVVKNTIKADIRFVENLASDGFLLFSGGDKRKQTAKEVAAVLNDISSVSVDDVSFKEIPSQCITRVVGQDSIDASFGWWEDIDAETSKASVQGDIEDSTHAQRIQSTGDPIWVQFTSERYSSKVGVSTSSVVFYGSDWTPQMMEDYVKNIVIENM